MSKGPDAFRTISEVAEELDLPQHVLRFWETRFSQIRPMKRGGGRRYYRPDDVELLKGIRHLLYGEGYTIKGVQRILKEQGARQVIAAGQGAAFTPVPASALDDAGDYEDEGDEDIAAAAAEEDAPASGRRRAGPERREPVFGPPAPQAAPRAPEPAPPPPREPTVLKLPPAPAEPERSAEAFRPPPIVGTAARPQRGEPSAPPAWRSGNAPAEDDDPIPLGIRPRSAEPAEGDSSRHPAAPAAATLSRDDLRKLQTTLFDLLECKRILDQAR
ncbi:DNA-binding transcriptional MerR regulator [Prosthecomicrobium pneumaticum]|uniref:DNA-binding transcriptional MerR regulator n=1 Tax=Prosthecomicrobium pneumaticum TaxID=81895 RepID=A0A7W9L3P7_9HYPH|nr:DNA-binding transcriptional MerR regulator [Prosthecomicrobium pneumaticum]